MPRLDKIALVGSLAFGTFVYGYCAGVYSLFPHSLLTAAYKAYVDQREFWGLDKHFWQNEVLDEEKGRRALANPVLSHATGAFPGINVIDTYEPDGKYLIVRLVDMDGKTMHEWKIDW